MHRCTDTEVKQIQQRMDRQTAYLIYPDNGNCKVPVEAKQWRESNGKEESQWQRRVAFLI